MERERGPGAVVASILELRCDFRTGAVFLGFPPIKNAKVGDVCSHDSKWSRAVQAGLAGFDVRRGVRTIASIDASRRWRAG